MIAFLKLIKSAIGWAAWECYALFFCNRQPISLLNKRPLPNQELSVLYGGPTLNYGEQLSLYVPYMLRVSMTGDLAHLQLSDLQG